MVAISDHTFSLTDREIQSFWDYFSASRWNTLSDMPFTGLDDQVARVPACCLVLIVVCPMFLSGSRGDVTTVLQDKLQ